LTIADIKRLPPNKPVNIFLMDRNVLNLSQDSRYNSVDTPTRPSVFFKHGYFITFTKTGGCAGRWIFNSNPSHTYIKEFDVELGVQWVSAKNNIVAGTSLDDLDTSTRLGWRGPMMLIQNMDLCDNILWTE
jgi:hypothetical protein